MKLISELKKVNRTEPKLQKSHLPSENGTKMADKMAQSEARDNELPGA